VFVVGAGVWALNWGQLFLPHRVPDAAGPRLVVLAYNALGYNLNAAETVRVVREAGADVVALQELNPATAAAIERDLAGVYPFRWLEPREGVSGAGLLSKFPMVLGTPLPDIDWVGRPLVAELEVGGSRVTVIRFHAASGPGHLRRRERQAAQLAAFARSHDGPLVLAGDLNATDQHRAYALITSELHDAWRVAGWGWGHTFPGPPTRRQGGSRPVVLGVPAPMWLIRVDYVFYSSDLAALDAHLAPFSATSDHRGVVATLALR
jgi:endonuclease/exonuclease/phosphatase (EEP) superfamily protein YafD